MSSKSIFQKLEEKPPTNTLNRYVLLSAISAIIIYIIIAIFFYLSGSPLSKVIPGQISFSGTYLKDIYWETANLSYYKISQILDYIFMISYGILLFSLSVKVTRDYPQGSLFKTIGYSIAIGGIIAACLDGLENVFILLTLTNPLGFPDWYAITQSSFSVPKWILIFIAIVYILIAYFYRKIKKI